MDKLCLHCQAVKFAGEKHFKCCQSGKVLLEPLSPYPVEFHNLLTGITALELLILKIFNDENYHPKYLAVGKNKLQEVFKPATIICLVLCCPRCLVFSPFNHMSPCEFVFYCVFNGPYIYRFAYDFAVSWGKSNYCWVNANKNSFPSLLLLISALS